MAYIFGFWCADGCIYNGRCFDITLHKKDKYILKKIAEEFKYEGPIYDYVDKSSIVGVAENKLYLVFKKGDDILNYEDYI